MGRHNFLFLTYVLNVEMERKGRWGLRVDFYISPTGVGMRNYEASIREEFIGYRSGTSWKPVSHTSFIS